MTGAKNEEYGSKSRGVRRICAVILSATVYYVSYARFKGARVPFRTYLRDAEGIEPGTQVLFGGITVGKVTSVQPDKVDPTRIEILLDVRQGTPLNEKSVAAVGSVSLMGEPGSGHRHGCERRAPVAAGGGHSIAGNRESG